MINEGFNFEVTNGEVTIRFSCNNYKKRISETIDNLSIGEKKENDPLLQARFVSTQKDVHFIFTGVVTGNCITRTAVFFENTDYPVLVKRNKESVILESFYVGGHKDDSLSLDDNLLYGMINFHNQVGQTEFAIEYTVDGKKRVMSFYTEVLSFKMDYRTDMKRVIAEIEAEYSMLSYSFLKQTYLSFQTKPGKSTDLIWWQIFQSCYKEIVESTRIIINSPKMRLHTATKYEKAERLQYVGPEQENEFEEFKYDPSHLYRTEELYLSKDTVENRFLKHVLNEVARRFNVVREHIRESLNVNDPKIGRDLELMSDTLLQLTKHPFFKSIGRFRGFNQDSLVMKRSRGYSTIYKNWVLLSCGYELESGIHHLEVKDISELYEIWCFIRVKNMVQDILKDRAAAVSSGKSLTTGFIRQLVYGAQSEVKFIEGETELASVMYNAQTEEDTDSDRAPESAIQDTRTFTTVQRPDIVLRLSKTNDSIQYTYLFDAKYRIHDNRKYGVEVPPPDAIDQMHRYRDAIYYSESSDNRLKKEVIGGYVLYPGNLNHAQYVNSYYHKSISQVGIGAFPLKPGKEIIGPDGYLILDPSSSESVLYEQIRAWINDEQSQIHLLETSIPQRGLRYESSELPYLNDIVLIGYVKHYEPVIKWIKDNGFYVVRLNTGGTPRNGEIIADRTYMNVQHILLYTDDNNLIGLYDIKDSNSIPTIITRKELKSKYGYPSAGEPENGFLLYKINVQPSILDVDVRKFLDNFSIAQKVAKATTGKVIPMTVKDIIALTEDV